MTAPALAISDRVWFDTAQAAVYTGWSRKTVVRALQSGQLRGTQHGKGGRWRIHRDWLDEWVGGAS